MSKRIAGTKYNYDGPTRWHEIAGMLDCNAGESYSEANELEIEDVVLESIRRIERAIERSPHDPGHNWSLVERVEAVMRARDA